MLKLVKIYYFTGSGNSLAVARRIVRNVPDAVLLPIIQAIAEAPTPSDALTPADQVGLVFPIHMTGIPRPVRRFLETADFSAVDYLFAVATHGGYPGNVGSLINRILSRRPAPTRLLDEYFPLQMINNTPKGVAPKILMRMNWADSITPELVQHMVSRTDPEIDAIITSVAVRTTGFADRYRTDRRSRGSLGTRLLWRLSEGSSPKLPFLLDTDACTRCGICRDVCPSGRVVIAAGGFPSWPVESPCYYCYSCFNFCPEQAVGVRHYTRKDGRYHYPGTTAADIAAQKSWRESGQADETRS
jgi:NAD-dependent dihydropyrimidine dehydrogenase PreA subunit